MKSPFGIVLGCFTLIVVAVITVFTLLYEDERVINGKTVACVGVTEGAFRDSTYAYEVSTRNVVAGVILSETVIAPVYIVLKDFHCPVAKP